MPHIRFRGTNTELVKTLSKTLPIILAPVLQTDTGNFSFELVSTDFFDNGNPSEGSPFVEFLWFDRGQDIQDICAKLVTEQIKILHAADYITVVFIDIAKNNYYENSKHF